MTLAAGSRLGPYEIVSRIGAGGMGEVFRARDTRLERSVAIKILPAEFASNSSFKLRFDREAKTISQLNHPHICTVFDVGETALAGEPADAGSAETMSYLVMELLEGESLADRIARGPLPLQEVVRYGAQIAEALDRAHRAGVIHRDLKPGNVMLTKSGAKLLDFGLAKGGATVIGGNSSASSFLADGETQMKPLTEQGQIIGTFQYMAPEQLEGAEADPRTDIFALGAVLYEMTTGRRAFEGRNRTSLIAAIVNGTPRPINELQPMTPPALEHLILRCLEKEPEQRWQSAHDVAEELKWIGAAGSQASAIAVAPGRAGKRRILLAAAALAIALTSAGLAWFAAYEPSVQLPVVRADVALNPGILPGTSGRPFAISPDGRSIAYITVTAEGDVLAVRRLDRGAEVVISGTRGARQPGFSPDGQWVSFTATGGLRKVPVTGGAPQLIAEGNANGTKWNDDGYIYFTSDFGLERVRNDGSGRTVLADSAGGTRFFGHVSVLPDRRTLLLDVASSESRSGSIVAFDIEKKTVRTLRAGANPRVLPTGQILYTEGNTLFVAKYDTRRQMLGPGVPVLTDVAIHPVTGVAFYDISDNGVFLYLRGTVAIESGVLAWIDRSGKVDRLALPPRPYAHPRLSRDGKRVALAIRDAVTDVWVLNLERQTLGRLTFEPSENEMPSWMPDDRNVIFSASRKNEPRIHLLKSFDGTGGERKVFNSRSHQHISSISSDGKRALVVDFAQQTGTDVWIYPLDGSGQRQPLLVNKFDEQNATFSPDGKWIAYTSTESGIPEVYVVGATQGGKWQVSTDGGRNPVWSRDGKELFYIQGSRMMKVDVAQGGESFVASLPAMLFEGKFQMLPRSDTNFDVASDGRFLVVMPDAGSEGRPLQVIVNYFEELEGKGTKN